MQMERSGNIRGDDGNRSCAHTGNDTAKNERIGVHGIPKREEQPHNIPKVGELWYYYKGDEKLRQEALNEIPL